MFLHYSTNFRFVKSSVDFEEIFDGLIGLTEPELIKIKDRGVIAGAVVGASKPDSVAFGFAEFATGDGVDDEGSGPDIGGGVLEAAN